MINPITGISGIIATVVALLFAYWIGLDRQLISYGTYSYNALMVGMVLGAQYNLTWSYLVVILFGSILTVLFAVWFNTLLFKYKLPSLSLSFLVTLWIIILGLRTFTNVELSDSGLFRMNEWYDLGGSQMVDWMNKLENSGLPSFVEVYLKSISAVFFQYNILAGILILIGLIIWSRIAFVISILGFVIGYLFYYGLAGEFTQLYYSYIGFNFILTAISLGGFYLIPSRASFILVLITMPIIGLFISGLNGILNVFQLPLYSLPFTFVVILILMLLHQRVYFNRLVLVPYQYFSPEKNLYHYSTQVSRFQKTKLFNLQLPFYGEWYVSQGNDGNITHREEWKDALDFVVVDETAHTFKLPAEQPSDFYCFNLPVLAPLDGYIVEVLNGIEDNPIGEINLEHNWGNTLVIKHTDGLYSKLSHLKNDSIAVRINDFVKKGQIIAACGSSGRSPEPHLHFQLQATPYIGSKTLNYPLGYFVSRINETYTLHEFETPNEGAHLHNPIQTELLSASYQFTPGKKISFEVTDVNQKKSIHTWECLVNAWNQTFLYCPNTKATAYCVNNGTLFYFTEFYGSKNSLLFEFYLANQKILLGYYENMCILDQIPVTKFHKPWALWLQDSIAPFYQFLKVKYESNFVSIDNIYAPNEICIQSRVQGLLGLSILKERSYEMIYRNGMLANWTVTHQHKQLMSIQCIDTQFS